MILNPQEQFILHANARNILAQPFLKWAGGKRQLLPTIRKYLPQTFNTYYEPFVGAGALLFEMQPKKAVINDVNTDLINCYTVIRDLPTDLIQDLKKHENSSEYFYSIRELDRTNEFKNLNLIERASRIIYLNKTCYNGLFRVNRQGQFNSPFGRYKKPNYFNPEVLYAISSYLNENDVKILNVDFSKVVETAEKGDFIYFDPPYDPLSETSSFTGYSLNQFGKSEQERLKDVFEALTIKGCKVMLSNSSTEFISKLYEDYNIVRIQANRNINSVGSGRKKIEEYLILNYNPDNDE